MTIGTGMILVDIDSTMNDHPKRIRKYTSPIWPNGRISNEAFTRHAVMKDKVIANCIEILTTMNSTYHVHYLSARGWPDAMEITKDWLKSVGAPNPTKVTLTNNMYQKIEVLKGMSDVLYYIDDFTSGQENSIPSFRKEIAEEIEALGIQVIVARNDWLDIWDQFCIYESRRN